MSFKVEGPTCQNDLEVEQNILELKQQILKMLYHTFQPFYTRDQNTIVHMNTLQLCYQETSNA